MYQLDFVDFSEFAENAFLSSLGQSILKNNNFRFRVAMVTKQLVAENWPKIAQIEGKFTTNM